jgi:cation diffusion facilitator CzcD-associated flavoprotein CzcO
MKVYDAVVVGAGPYGLSTAAHLRGRGLRVAVFGKTLEMWRHRMPKGMLLRSHWWASNLSDPGDEYGFARFFREAKYQEAYPARLQAFIDYGLWFKDRAVPDVDETYVASIEREGGRFRLALEDGREVRTAAVVMAIGLHYYANRLATYDHLPSGLVSHSCDHSDFSLFKSKQVIVIGGGQSAIEFAALLHEAGATVQVVARRPLMWLAPDRANERTVLERILAPNASIAPGWSNWMLDHLPYFFHRFPQESKDRYNSNYMSGASDWLRDRVIGKVTLHERQTVVAVKAMAGRVEAALADGAKVTADHVLLATGYKVDVNRLAMLHSSLRADIEADGSIPLLNQWFESSVPGLYFIGLSSLRAFGPLFRFVAGCRAAARRVASAVARQRVGRARATA